MGSTLTATAGNVVGKMTPEPTRNQIRKQRRRAGDAAQGFATDGFSEFNRLQAMVQTYGALTTAKKELEKDKEYVEEADGTLRTLARAGQTGGQLVGVMLTITLAAAIGFVGTKVISEIDGSIDTTEGTNYDNASDSIGGGFADAMGLTDIVFLVLMFSVILAALLAFRGQR
jgi:hypothetical protein